ncbi:hypothetical protein TNCV_979841 [Trichonephila clavipes]|uniref:Uncharacterized protein n=1 Tax=Trichonephila clavipes TaxID=2585209 RepID=A0A8X6VD16_TRICX|nr:hypothetical protein TNCV_979841 [Trichonephila clavipes]
MTAQDGQGLLWPTPWALRCVSRCSNQVVSLTRKPPVLSSQASLVLLLLTHLRDERLSQPCLARAPILFTGSLSTTDFHLFNHLEQLLWAKQYENEDSLKSFIFEFIDSKIIISLIQASVVVAAANLPGSDEIIQDQLHC